MAIIKRIINQLCGEKTNIAVKASLRFELKSIQYL